MNAAWQVFVAALAAFVGGLEGLPVLGHFGYVAPPRDDGFGGFLPQALGAPRSHTIGRVVSPATHQARCVARRHRQAEPLLAADDGGELRGLAAARWPRAALRVLGGVRRAMRRGDAPMAVWRDGWREFSDDERQAFQAPSRGDAP